MRRLITAAALSVALSATLVLVPALDAGAHPQPHPVRVTAETIPLHPDATRARRFARSAAPTAAPRPATTAGGNDSAAGRMLVSTGQLDTQQFSMLGVTWDHDPQAGDIDVRVRARATGGTWTGWTDLGGASATGPSSKSPDTRGARAVRPGTEPLWTGPSDGVQVTITLESGRAPAGIKLSLIDPGHSDYDAKVGRTPAGSAYAADAAPHIHTRAEWGADESWRTKYCNGKPDYGDSIKMAFVHHSGIMDNDYTRSDVPKIIRGYYHLHVFGRHWCDIGYNFLVDKFGRIWEGRAGGVDRPVLGAHTGGFNTNTVGVDMIGDYISVSPSSALRSGLAHLLAWKLGRNFDDPDGKVTLTAGNFSGQRWPAHQPHTFAHTISGHRDADRTVCPGDAGYAALPDIRSRVEKIMAAPLVHPHLSVSGSAYTVRFGLPVTPATVTLTVTDGGTQIYRKQQTTSANHLAMTWNAVTASRGNYSIHLQAKSRDGTGRPWSKKVALAAPERLAGHNRFATAAAVSHSAFPKPGSAAAVVLARGDEYPDALAGGPLALARGAPILLTKPGRLVAQTAHEIDRVLPSGGTVYLLGGKGALSAHVGGQLRGDGYQVVRYGGDDRFATARIVADHLGKPARVFVARGDDFPDALSAAAAANATTPILLTKGDTEPAQTKSYLAHHGGVPVYAIGGPAARAVPSATGVLGANRFDTAAAVAKRFFDAPTRTGLASAHRFADALVAGPLLATEGAPLLLTNTRGLPDATSDYLGNTPSIVAVQIFGGKAVVSGQW
jgi:putative cell wall-binding protein